MKICVWPLADFFSTFRRAALLSSVFSRKIAAKSETLAIQTGSHKSQHQRRRTGHGNYINVMLVAKFHQNGAWISHGRKTGLGNQSNIGIIVEKRYILLDLRPFRMLIEFMEFQLANMALESSG